MNIFNIAEKFVGRSFTVRVTAQVVDQYNWARRLRWAPGLFDAAEDYVDRSGLTRCKYCHCILTERFVMNAHIACRDFMSTLPSLLIAVSENDMVAPMYLIHADKRAEYFRTLVQRGNPFKLSPFIEREVKYTPLAA